LCTAIPNGPEAAVCFFAFALRCTFAPLNIGLSRDEYEFEFTDLPAKALVVQEKESLSEEDQKNVRMPDMYRCDACHAVMYNLGQQLKKEQETLLTGLDMMNNDRERIEKEHHESTMEIEKLKVQIEDLVRTENSLKSERKERESTLRDKELKIETYSIKVNTLKKFKHILDKRLAEVTQSLQPKDHMIDQLNANLKELEAEYEKQRAALTETMNAQIKAKIALEDEKADVILKYNADEAKTIAKYDEVCKIGFDLWQVKSGTIFDNIIITDDPAVAKKHGEDFWAVTKDAEKKMKDEQDEEERKKAEAEAQKDEDLDNEDLDDVDEEEEEEDKTEEHDEL